MKTTIVGYGRRARIARGFTMIEVLVAGVILATSVLGLIRFIYVDYNLTSKSGYMGAAYTCGRSAIEEAHLVGFMGATEGNTYEYYDSLGSYPPLATQASGSVYKVTTNVSTDQISLGVPQPHALRTVSVTVALISTGQTIYQTYSALASGGV